MRPPQEYNVFLLSFSTKTYDEGITDMLVVRWLKVQCLIILVKSLLNNMLKKAHKIDHKISFMRFMSLTLIT